MKLIKYMTVREDVDKDTMESKQVIEYYGVQCSDRQLDSTLAEIINKAYNGEYTIEDDGEPEPEPTEQEQLRADVDFLLAMGGVL